MISKRRSWTMWLAVLPLSCALIGCGGGDKPKAGSGGGSKSGTSTSGSGGEKASGGTETTDGGTEKPSGAAPATVTGWGTIKGTVTYDGQAPEQKLIHKAGADIKDRETCSTKDLPSDELLVNPSNGGIQWVLVYVAGKPPVHPDLEKVEGEVEFGQEFCRFKPHLLAWRAGQALKITSSDPVTHNTNLKPWRGDGANTMLPAAPPGEKSVNTQPPDIKAQPRPFPVECNVHGWMKAMMMVFDHPYFAVTDENGNFEIKHVPAGKVNVISWQETCLFGEGGREGKDVDVTPDGVTELNLKTKVPAK